MIPVLSSSLANEGNQIFIQPDGSQNKCRCANTGLLILTQRQACDAVRAENMAAGVRLIFSSVLLHFIPIRSVLFSPNAFLFCSILYTANSIQFYFTLFYCTLFSPNSILFLSLFYCTFLQVFFIALNILHFLLIIFFILMHSILFYSILLDSILQGFFYFCYILFCKI